MPLLRKDLKIGLLAGAVLLVLAVIYALVLTFSGSPEPPQLATAQAQQRPEADTPFSSSAQDPPSPSDETPPELTLGSQSLARTAQTAAGDWSAYGFNGNPPVVTQTPTPGSRDSLATDAVTDSAIPDVHPRPQDIDPGITAADAMPATRTHVVAAGETLSAIAEKYYSDPNLYGLIEKANPRLEARRLKVGQKLLIPDRDSGAGASATTPAETQTPVQSPAGPGLEDGVYEVRPGDTLARIAARRYGREALWEEIYKLNLDLIGADPAKLKVGMKLKMPS